ncbi:Haloacid dehalogenase domain protein hydrolase [Caldalkalibacillus thermarum TA2.A1]|uniref:HAD-IA family hydrolase n=1 Tax=Caldalkalibacillus thermarum (strain TA2.A1) TaxID=986075 RepID=F5L626_CALTT|nr:HAD-IA family hydrolase [Caldalkalibacillus thermarum]EGL83229.1 Haloacid dehalogenase domain protein hydrolase [Caldalkalibacillus thermarum TA2.A1]QZT34807.1 HAD-IA family hydrolase [Caldalkalibacillus thermarum TA2.A1]
MSLEHETLRPGVLAYLQEAKQLGLKVGLASSSSHQWVMEHLERYNIAHYFDSIHTADTVKQVKPHPELYEQAVNALGVSADEAVAFEDSLNGLKAAKSAGLYCVIVPNPTTAALPFEGFDLRLQSMEELSLQEVINRILSSQRKSSAGGRTNAR